MSDQPKTINEEAGLPENWVPVDRPPLEPGRQNPDSLLDGNLKYLQGSLPSSYQHDSSFVNTTYKSSSSPTASLVPLGIQADPATNAAIQSTIINTSAPASVPATPATVTDGLTHGNSVWDYDSAYVSMRDDFMPYLNNAVSPGSNNYGIGELGWSLFGSVANPTAIGFGGGAPPNIGQFSWENYTVANDFGALLMNDSTGWGTSSYQAQSMALLENPGWKMAWVFKVDGGTGTGVGEFSAAKKSIYVGLTGPGISMLSANISARPDVFIGLRFDTSASPGTVTLSAAANASGGDTVYTASSNTFIANGGAIGLTFVVSGFATGANNGTFLCVASTSTSLTLVNASGVAETHAATAVASGLNDAFYTLEAVFNPTYQTGARHNKQGTTYVTNIAPTPGTWHRLEIACSTAGIVVITLDGSTTNTLTVTCPQITVQNSSTGQASAKNQIGRTHVTVANSGTSSYYPWAAGSQVAVSGLTGGNTILNGPQVFSYVYQGTDCYFDISSSTTVGNNTTNATLVGYPALAPLASFGNDDTASPAGNDMRMVVDFFAFIWNPALRASGGTPDATKPRYW